MNKLEELKSWIMKELPPEGEWYSDGYLGFIESAEKMISHEMSIDIIKGILYDCYSAVSSEYGN